MKWMAVSLYQPYASLVAKDLKRYIVRNQNTPYRGPILIHASKWFRLRFRKLCDEAPFASSVRAIELPRSSIVAIADLTDCMDSGYAKYLVEKSGESEPFTDFSAARWAWRLENIEPLIKPVPASGRNGLWEPVFETETLVEMQLELTD